MWMIGVSIKQMRLPAFLLVLLLFLIAYPYLHQKFPEQIAVVEVCFAFLMISGVSLLETRKKVLVFMFILAIMVLAGIIIVDITQSVLLLCLIMLIELIFFSIIFVSLLNYIYTQEKVTLDKIYAAVTSYLVLGILFAVLYTLVGTILPDSFQYTVLASVPLLNSFPHPAFFSEALYFSFVTLGTLGYGDWVPVFGPIKMIASLEAISGQLFIAILIARLVGVQISQSIVSKRL